MKKSRLYVIVDRQAAGRRSIFDIASKLKRLGAGIVQFRDKVSDKETVFRDALILKELFLESGILFIINDYVYIAKILDSDGVHLGWADASIGIARRLLGRDRIIGISCHNIRQAIIAQDSGADYISIGPIFATPTKPEYKAVGLNLIKEARKKIKIPLFVIGDININNINTVLSQGAQRIAVCRPVCQAKDVASAANNLSKILHRDDAIRIRQA